MVHDSISSPHRRTPVPASFKKPTGRDELGSWSTFFTRHRFLLSMLALLALLCAIYLYFAVTLGATESCSTKSGSEKALCEVRATIGHGKLKLS